MLPRWYIESVSRCWPAEVVASTYQQMFYAALGSSEVGLQNTKTTEEPVENERRRLRPV